MPFKIQYCFLGTGKSTNPILYFQTRHALKLSFIVGNERNSCRFCVCCDPQIVVTNSRSYYSPDELLDQIGLFVDHYNNCRYHEALKNLIPAGVYFDKG